MMFSSQSSVALCTIIIIFLFKLSNACMPSDKSNSVTIDSDTYVCVTIQPIKFNSSGTYLRQSSVVKADNFTAVSIKGAWNSTTWSSDAVMTKLGVKEAASYGIGITVESMGIISYRRIYRYYDSEYGKITYPLLMAIITVDKGTVTSINWDGGCSFCESSKCTSSVYNYQGEVLSNLGNACFVQDNVGCLSPDGTSQTNSLCALNVYVVWTGTDSAGNNFMSSASRFSRLDATQMATVTNSLKAITSSY